MAHDNPPEGAEPATKVVKIEALGNLDASITKLRAKFGVIDPQAANRFQGAFVDPERAERFKKIFGVDSGATRPSAAEMLSRLQPDLPDPKTQPPHRTMAAVERMAADIQDMTSDIEVLAKAALGADVQNRRILFWTKIAVLIGVIGLIVALIK